MCGWGGGEGLRDRPWGWARPALIDDVRQVGLNPKSSGKGLKVFKLGQGLWGTMRSAGQAGLGCQHWGEAGGRR